MQRLQIHSEPGVLQRCIITQRAQPARGAARRRARPFMIRVSLPSGRVAATEASQDAGDGRSPGCAESAMLKQLAAPRQSAPRDSLTILPRPVCSPGVGRTR